jgi:hypothetical protein
MRLCYCYHCHTLSKIADYEGEYREDSQPLNDVLLENWVQRHMHGFSEEQHPGGRVFAFVGRDIEVQGGRFDGRGVPVANEVEHVRTELARAGQEVFELKDELKEDAHKCFLRHKRPTYPDRKCIDYHDDSKWLGRKEHIEGQTLAVQQGYLCSYCPYEVNVSVTRRGYN